MSVRVSRGELDAPDGRYHRQELIPWWRQDRLEQARLLVIGAGALGNEVLKALALIGIGRVLVVDMDRIERSNLSRAVLFRDGDEGRSKAEVAVARMRELGPEIRARALDRNVVHAVGLGVFAWADVVIGCVDSREARIFVSGACARTRRTWVDGAIEGFSGIVRAFRPHDGVCYECTMNEVDRRQVAERRSCALLAREARAGGHVPATATTAALVGALQVQEAIKILHGQPALIGEGIHLDGLHGQFSRVSYPRRGECYGHEDLPEIEPLGLGVADASLGELLARAETELGEGAVIEMSRDLVTALTCPECERREEVGSALGSVRESDAACPACRMHRLVEVTSSLSRDGPLDLERTPAGIGLPPYDVVVARRGLDESRAWLFDGDEGEVLGDLASDGGRRPS